MKKFTLLVTAIQLVLQEDAPANEKQYFEGAEIKGISIVEGENSDAFAMVPYQGGHLRVNDGQWLVSYDDGVKEVYSDEDFKKTFSPANGLLIDLDAVEVAIQNPPIGADGQKMTPKEVIDMFFETGTLISRKSGKGPLIEKIGDEIQPPIVAPNELNEEVIPPAAPAEAGTNPETFEHEITQEDMDNNPQFAIDGLKVGDKIQVPRTEA